MVAIDSNVIAAIIGAALPASAGGLQFYRTWRDKQWQTVKVAYVKVVQLRRVGDGPPAYSAYVARLGQTVEVFDEVNYFRLNVYPNRRTEFPSEDRSSGVIDLRIVNPYREKLEFTDQGLGKVPNYLAYRINGSGNAFFTHSVYYNGLQPGNEDIGMKMQMETREARLIVDFSSLPNVDEILTESPTGRKILPSGVSELLGVANPTRGIYVMHASNVPRETVLRMDFKINWTATAV